MESYNVVTDTVSGFNFRLGDNLIQLGVIVATVIIGVVVGALVADDPRPGAMLGGVGGLVVGFLISGFVIMIYRAMQHAKGKHD